MKLGLSSFTYSWAVGVKGYPPAKPMSFMDLIKMTHHFGLSVLQIGDNLPLDKLPLEELKAGRKALLDYQIELEIGCRGLHEETLQKYLDLCIFFSSRLLRIVIDSEGYEPSDSEVIRILKKFAPEFEKYGIILAIENHDRFRSKGLSTILNKVNSDHIGICLDTANSLGCLEGIQTITESLIPFTVNLHAKDIVIHRLPNQLGFHITGKAAGHGMLDMGSILKQVYCNRKNTNCILEQWTKYTGNLEETIRKEAEDAEIGISALRQLIAEAIEDDISFKVLEKKVSRGNCTVESIKLEGKSFTQLMIEYPDIEDDVFPGDTSQIMELCEEHAVTHIYAKGFFQEELLYQRKIDTNDLGLIQKVLSLAGNITSCNEVIFPLGADFDIHAHTLSQLDSLEEHYFENLAQLIAMCRDANIAVGFHLRQEGSIDNSVLFMQKLLKNNVRNYKIYR